MKIFFYTFFILILFSCSQESKKIYYDFDEIIHYSIPLPKEEEHSSPPEHPDDKILDDILFDYYPKNLSDSSFLRRLDSIPFNKRSISPDLFKSIREIFTEKKSKNSIMTACIIVYRDILIFRKGGKIVGITKICFTCGDSYLVGTKLNTEDFGQDGDYGKLFNLLKK